MSAHYFKKGPVQASLLLLLGLLGELLSLASAFPDRHRPEIIHRLRGKHYPVASLGKLSASSVQAGDPDSYLKSLRAQKMAAAATAKNNGPQCDKKCVLIISMAGTAALVIVAVVFFFVRAAKTQGWFSTKVAGENVSTGPTGAEKYYQQGGRAKVVTSPSVPTPAKEESERLVASMSKLENAAIEKPTKRKQSSPTLKKSKTLSLSADSEATIGREKTSSFVVGDDDKSEADDGEARRSSTLDVPAADSVEFTEEELTDVIRKFLDQLKNGVKLVKLHSGGGKPSNRYFYMTTDNRYLFWSVKALPLNQTPAAKVPYDASFIRLSEITETISPARPELVKKRKLKDAVASKVFSIITQTKTIDIYAESQDIFELMRDGFVQVAFKNNSNTSSDF